MIEKLTIKNFKSIKDLEIDCKQINLLIGEPNTGKSNILEALGLFSWLGHASTDLHDFTRFEEPQDLFFDDLVDEKIAVSIRKGNELSVEIHFAADKFRAAGKIEKTQRKSINLSHTSRNEPAWEEFSFLKYYKFLKQKNFPVSSPGSLQPPFGANLFSVLMGKKEISGLIRDFYAPFNLKFMLETRDKTFKVVKQRDSLFVSYPYSVTSDTLQRIVFFTAAMESNRDSTLVFEEPESFAFPYYTKYLGERIARNESNQYFISTHNPYLLLAILEKAPKQAVNVLVTYVEEYQTRVKVLSEEEISVLMDADPFLNLESFLDEPNG